MKFQLITNDTDTIVGMRLAGISGVKVNTKEETEKALLEAIKMENVAIILITERLAEMCEELVKKLKVECHKPLICVIPDSKSDGKTKNSIMKYVQEAIGVKI